jgi:hypothetical protein
LGVTGETLFTLLQKRDTSSGWITYSWWWNFDPYRCDSGDRSGKCYKGTYIGRSSYLRCSFPLQAIEIASWSDCYGNA